MDKFEEFGKRIDEEFARIKSIKNFEDFGKRVDEELECVKSFCKGRGCAGNGKAYGAIFARGFRKAHRGGGMDRSAQCRAQCAERPAPSGRAASAESAIFMTQAAL